MNGRKNGKKKKQRIVFSLGTMTLSCVKDCFYYLKVGQTGRRRRGEQWARGGRSWKRASTGCKYCWTWKCWFWTVWRIKQIREVDPNAHIVVLTMYDGDEDIYEAIKAGAKGDLLKDATREALMDCIHKVHIGETSLPSILAAKLADRVSGEL